MYIIHVTANAADDVQRQKQTKDPIERKEPQQQKSRILSEETKTERPNGEE